MKFKLKTFILVILLVLLAVPVAACASPYESIKISLSTSVSAIDSNDSVTLRRQRADVNNQDANKFTITASVSAKKGVPTDLEVTSSKNEIVTILNVDYNESNGRTTVYCEANNAGEAQINFVSYGGKSKTLRVYVDEPLRSISVNRGYTPYVYRGDKLQFDTTQIKYNYDVNGILLNGAVEPNVENRKIEYSVRESGVTVTEDGLIAVDSSFANSTGTFELYMRPANGAYVDEAGVDTYSKTITVVDKPVVMESQFKISEIESIPNRIEPINQILVQNNVALIDLALFRTDSDHKGATITIDNSAASGYKIVGGDNSLATVFSFEEVNALGLPTTSSNISIERSEYVNNKFRIMAGERGGVTAYVNVYAQLEGSESTKTLIAQITVYVEDMPSKINLNEVNGFYEDATGTTKPSFGQTLTDYLTIYNTGVKHVYPQVFSGAELDEDARVRVVMSDALTKYINIYGAEIDADNDKTTIHTYIINNKNSFGLEIKNNVKLDDIGSLSESDKTIEFKVAKDYSLPNSNKTDEYYFDRISKKVVLDLLLTIDDVKLWIEGSKNSDNVTSNIEFLEGSNSNLFSEKYATESIGLQMPVNHNVNDNKFLDQIVLSFVPYLNGTEFKGEYSASSIKFVCYDIDGNVVTDVIANSMFVVSQADKTITIKPNTTVVGEYVLRIEGFGVNGATHFVKVNFYAKPYDVYFTLNGNRVDAHNMQVGDEIVLPVEGITRVGNVEEVLTNANLTVEKIELKSFSGSLSASTTWFKVVGQKYLQFNSRNANSGTYTFEITVADGGNNKRVVNLTIVVYEPINDTNVFVEASGSGNNAIISNFNTSSLTENFYTTSTTYFADQQSRVYNLKLNGIDDVEKYLSDNSAYVVRYLNNQEVIFGNATTIVVSPLAQNGVQTAKFVIKQIEQADIVVEIRIEYNNAVQATELNQYNGLTYVSKEEGYQLYRSVDNGLLEDFEIVLDNVITANATDKRIGYFLDENASNFASVENGVISFKAEDGVNVAGEGYLYVYAFDALNNVLDKHVSDTGVITGNLTAADFANCSNYIKIKLVVADGTTTPIVISSADELKNINADKNYQLASNVKLANSISPIVFNGTIDGNGFAIYNVNLASGNKLFDGGIIKNLLIGYVDGTSEIYLADGTLASSALSTIGAVSTVKTEIEFTPHKPVDLSQIFSIDDENATLSYTLTYKNSSSAGAGVVVGKFAVIEYAGIAEVTVSDATGVKATADVSFNYAGAIPASAKRSSNTLNFVVRKNWSVALGKVNVESPYHVVMAVIGFNNLGSDNLDDLTTLDETGRFSATRAGVYTIAESIVLDGFGVVCENIINVTVDEGPTNISVNMLNGTGNVSVGEPSAQIAPFETLVVKVRVTTDNLSLTSVKLALDNQSDDYTDYINVFKYSYGIETGVSNGNVLYKEYTYYISIAEEYQASILGNGLGFNVVALFNNLETTVTSKFYVKYVATLPNYIDFYNFKSSKVALSNSDLISLGEENSTNEIEPEFIYNNESLGGYQTFVFDVFPNYVASSDLKISTKSVMNLNNSLAPLPQVVLDGNAKKEFASGENATLVTLYNTDKKQGFNGSTEAGHLYYVIRVYVPLTRTEGDKVYRTEMGDKYLFTFTVSLGGESYNVSRTLEVVYPLYLTGLFVEAGTENKTFTSTDGTNGDLRDEVAIGTDFYMLFNVIDPSAESGALTIDYEYGAEADAFITKPIVGQNFNGKQLFTFNMIPSDVLIDRTGGDVKINSAYKKLYLYVTATKVYNGKTLKSNRLQVEIDPVLYKVKDVEIYKVDDSNGAGLLSLSNSNNASLAITANHTIKLAAVEEHYSYLDTDVLAAIEKSVNELNNNLNKTETITDTTYFPYLYSYKNGQEQNKFEFTIDKSGTAENAGRVPTWTDTNYTYRINYKDEYTYPSILFGLTTTQNTSLRLASNVKLQVEGGVYKIYDANKNELVAHEYNKAVDLDLYLSTTADCPYPIESFADLTKYVSRNENDTSFADANLILTKNITITEADVSAAGLSTGAATVFAANFASLDGNGHTIYLAEGAFDWLISNYQAGSASSDDALVNDAGTANVGLFTSIGENTIVKNLNVDFVYNAQTWSLKTLANNELANSNFTFNFGFLAGVNNGIITNCSVRFGGIVSIYPFAFLKDREQASVTANVGGLVGVNNGYITNSTVGGFDYTIETTVDSINKIETPITSLSEFIVGGDFEGINDGDKNRYSANGKFMVGGFVGKNTGKIASSKFANSNLTNGADQSSSETAGFAVENSGSIKYSYAEGKTTNGERSEGYIYGSTTVAGFVYTNLGYVGDCYANYKLLGEQVAGFVQENGSETDETINALIESCYTISNIVDPEKIGSRPFMGTTRNKGGLPQVSNNFGTINNSYYLRYILDEDFDDETEEDERYHKDALTESGVTGLVDNELGDSTSLTGFAFSLDESHDTASGIWKMRSVSPTLVAANTTTYTERTFEYVINQGTDNEYYFYSDARGAAYGSDHNPVIVYNVETFNKIADAHNNGYSYRLICDVKFDETYNNTIHTTQTTFSGKLDGNGMAISNLYINLQEQEENSVGLFANLVGTEARKAEVKAIDIDVTELYASQVAAVGVVAGIVSDANVYNVNVSSESGKVIHGKNAVGGVAGLVIGSSQIYNCNSSMDVLSTWSGSEASIAEIDLDSATAELLGEWNKGTFEKPVKAEGDGDDVAKNIANRISQISYAGGLVGVYAGTAIDDFTPMLSVLHAENIRVEGGVIGGAVGGVLTDALVTDLKYTTDLTRGKLKARIAAGGVVGENRGRIMFAISEHTKDVQAEIDAIDELGNLTNILDVSKYNNTLFDTQRVYAVGGLVGINVGGDISQGYSRINLNNTRASYAGGLVGVSNVATLANLYTTSGVYGSEATGGVVGYMPFNSSASNTLKLESIVAINLYTPTQQSLIATQTNKGSIVGLVQKGVEDGAISYLSGSSGLLGEGAKTSVITPYFYNFTGDKAGEPTGAEPLIALTSERENFAEINLSNVIKLNDDDPESDVVYTTIDENDPSNIIEVRYTLNNSVRILDRAEPRSLTRKGVFAAFYNDVNGVWETYGNAWTNKTALPRIVSFKNYRSSGIEIYDLEDLVDYVENCNSDLTSRYLRKTVTIKNSINLADLNKAGNEDLLERLEENRYNEHTLIGKAFNGSLKQDTGTTLNLAGYTLFEKVGSAVFEDLDVIAMANSTTNNAYGAIARKADNAVFTKCKLTINASSTNAKYVGGFVGEATTIGFSGCTLANFSITANNATHVGGFVGKADTVSALRGTNVTNFAITSKGVQAEQFVGGLVGYAQKLSSATTNVANGTITISNRTSANVGGVVGYINGDGVIDRATIDNVQIVSEANCNLNAGIIGGNTQKTRYTNCYVKGGGLTAASTGSGDHYAAGIAAQATAVQYSYSLATLTISASAKAQVAGLVGYLVSGGSATESFYSGVINGKVSTDVAGLIFKNNGIINKCFTNNLQVAADDKGSIGSNATKGANASGLVYYNGGILKNSYSTMRIEATNSAYGLVAVNSVEISNGISYNGLVINCYFAGRNMKAETRIPTYSLTTADDNSTIVYAKNFGFDGVNNGVAGTGKTISQMLKADGLATVVDDEIVYSTNDNTTFPLLISTAASREFSVYQSSNIDLVPIYINALSEIGDNTDGFFVLNMNSDSDGDGVNDVSILTEATFADTFSGVLASAANQIVYVDCTLFKNLNGATIFGLNLEGRTSNNNQVNGVAAIAETATGSVIANSSLDNALILNTQGANVGALVVSATNTDFYYSYVGEGVTLGGSGAASKAGNVGGLAAIATNGSFNSCYFAGTIKNASTMAGIYNTGSASITNCYVSGNLLNGSGASLVSTGVYTRASGISATDSYSIAYVQSETAAITTNNASNIKTSANGAWINNYIDVNGNSKTSAFPMLNGVGGQTEGKRVNPIKIEDRRDKGITAFDILQGIEPNSTKAYILMTDVTSTNMLTYKGNFAIAQNVNYVSFEPIYNFGGTFYGNNYTISNLLVTNKAKGQTTNGTNRAASYNSLTGAANYGDPLGMFSTTNNAYILDVKLNNAEMYASNVKDGAGFIVGAATGASYLRNCSVNNSMMYAGRFTPATSASNPELVEGTNVNDVIGGIKANNFASNNASSTSANNTIRIFNNFNANDFNPGATVSVGSVDISQIDKENEIYQIDDAAEFVCWAQNASNTSAVLTGNIDLSGYSFEKDGSLASVLENFSATLDGNGYYITGFTCYTFITKLEASGTVKNLNLFNVNVLTDTSTAAGMIALTNEGTIENCLTSGISGLGRQGSGSICSANRGVITNSFGAGSNTTSTVLQEWFN